MGTVEIEPTIKPRCIKYQYFATIVANLLTFSFGSGIGWFSPALPLLLSDSCPLESGKLTIDEESWIGALPPVGALIGNILGGFLVPRVGSKFTIMVFGMPQLLSWLLIIFGTQALHLEISRFMLGLTGGGLQCATNIYVAELADNNIRGKLATIYQLFWRFGVLFAFVVVSYFDYVKLAVFFIGITAIFYAVFMFLPQTPQYLLKINKTEDAEKAVQFYKGFQNRKESQTYISEMNRFKLFSEALKEEPKIHIKDFRDPQVLKALVQSVLMSLLSLLAGSYIILTYGTKITEQSGTRVPVEVATVIFGFTQMFGTILTSQLIDRQGRKFLLVTSMTGCCLSQAILSTYLYLHASGFDVEVIHWLPVLSMTLVLLSASLGVVPLIFVCLLESFPARLRGFGVTSGAIILNLLSFTIIKLFPILSEIIQLQGCMLIFSVSCGLGIIYMILVVKETKGKDLNVVKSQNENAPIEKS